MKKVAVEKSIELVRKAVTIIARRLRNEDGNYNIEACWAIGLLSAVAEMNLEELEQANEVYSRVTFASCGDNKIAAIKIVRTQLGCGLKKGKDIVEGLNHVNCSAADAHAIKEQCELECGSNVVVRPWSAGMTMSLGRGLDLSDDNDDIPF